MRRFMEIFNRDSDWSRSHKLARRAGLMIFLHPNKERDWATGVGWDPELFVRSPIYSGSSDSPMAWRRGFVEKVLALGFVPDLESLPKASDSIL